MLMHAINLKIWMCKKKTLKINRSNCSNFLGYFYNVPRAAQSVYRQIKISFY